MSAFSKIGQQTQRWPGPQGPEGWMPASGESGWSNAKGRRRGCKAQGLKGKAFRDCVRDLREEDKGRTKDEKKEAKKDRIARFKEAIAEGKVQHRFFGKVFKGVKTIGLAAPRNGLNVLVRLNAWGFASKMAKLEALSASNPQAKQAWNKLVAMWIQVGGSKKVFLKMIIKGKDKKPLSLPFSKKHLSADGWSNIITGAEEVAIVTATPLIITISSILASVTAIVGPIVASSTAKEEMDAEYDSNPGAYTITQEDKEEADDREELDKEIIPGLPNEWFWGGVAVVGVTVTFLIISSLAKPNK